MLELSTAKKNKILLSDYNYRRDIENRLLMAHFSPLDVRVIEDILFSPIRTPIRQVAENVDLSQEAILPILQKLENTGLFHIEGDSIVVDKEMRKYYEHETLKFSSDFKADMEFLQGHLKKVPIQFLPTWYAIPRTSNNIFDSLVEKYLYTPLIFQRYLMELNLGDPTLAAIAQDVYKSPSFRLTSKEVIKKYNLTAEQFEEYILLLEFNFVCCLGFQKVDDEWQEVVTPFHEWQEYLDFMRKTTPTPVSDPTLVERLYPSDFAFVQEMTLMLQAAKKQPVVITQRGPDVVQKATLLKLAEIKGNKLCPTETTTEWLEMRLENRALYLYRHPLNHICSVELPAHLQQEKVIREAEKAISRALYAGWVEFDAFLEGVIVPLGESSVVALKKTGKTWRYTLPNYTAEEKALIRATVFEWLMQAGITATGSYQGKACFCVTPFGQSLYG
jgi:hypothetical protein